MVQIDIFGQSRTEEPGHRGSISAPCMSCNMDDTQHNGKRQSVHQCWSRIMEEQEFRGHAHSTSFTTASVYLCLLSLQRGSCEAGLGHSRLYMTEDADHVKAESCTIGQLPGVVTGLFICPGWSSQARGMDNCIWRVEHQSCIYQAQRGRHAAIPTCKPASLGLCTWETTSSSVAGDCSQYTMKRPLWAPANYQVMDSSAQNRGHANR